MNLKAEKFKQYLAEQNINYFRVEESEDSDGSSLPAEDAENTAEKKTRVTFHTYVRVFGQKLPSVVIIDDSIYTIIRVQVIPDIEYSKNKDSFLKCVNEMNITYKAVKYYLGADNALYLDMYIPSNNDDIDGDLVINLLSALNRHLEKEYPNWMKLLWS